MANNEKDGTMKWLLIWWTIGCVVIGGQIGFNEKKSLGNDKHIPPIDMAASVSVWPAYLIWGFINL